MIAIGCASADERAFRAGAKIAIEALDEGDSLLLRRHRCDSIDEPYNEMRAVAAAREGLEALVLVHQDARLDPGRLPLESVRAHLAAEGVAVLCGGADGPPTGAGAPDGTLLALSPWAARSLRFDSLAGALAEASALDVAMQARAEGRQAVAAPLGLSRPWTPRERPVRRRELAAVAAVRRKWGL